MRLQRLSALFLIFFSLFAASCQKADKQPDIIEEFMQARIDGDTKRAYSLLDRNTKAAFSEQDFAEYCFVFKPSEFEVMPEENGYTKISYTFYDKKYKKGSDELYTFYMTKNIERVRTVDGKIVFPHIAFVPMRKAIESRDFEKAKFFSHVMLTLDPKNPDVLETSEKMGFIP